MRAESGGSRELGSTRPSVRRRAAALLLAFVGAFTLPWIASAQTGLTRVDGPKGGVIVYGPVPAGATSAPSAMGAVLRALHAQFAARPDVGRVFELRGSDSIAVHFVVQPPNAAQRGGMIVIAKNGGGGYEAGVVSDEALRLQTSFNPMLQALFAAWHPAGAQAADGPAPSAGRGGPGGPAEPLRTYVLPDRTASVGLPDGWKVAPASGGGTIFANGPRGEAVALGYTWLVIDTGTLAGRQLQQQAMGPLRNTSYAQNLYYPYGQPLGRTFVDLNRMDRALHHAQPAPLQIVAEEAMGQQGASRCTHLRGEVGAHDGSGPALLDAVFCVAPPERSANSWLTVSYTSIVPAQLAAEQRATLATIVASFREDHAAIQRQANQIAAPGIAAIREIGRQATQRAADADATRIGMRQSYEARSASQDRSSQAFSNYIRDQTVVVDRDTGTHGTVWNQAADSMVRTDPKRFGYVDTPNFWKGVDY